MTNAGNDSGNNAQDEIPFDPAILTAEEYLYEQVEEMIFNFHSNNIGAIIGLIESNPIISKNYVFSVIEHATSFNPYHHKMYGDLWKQLLPYHYPIKISPFSTFLYNQKIIPEHSIKYSTHGSVVDDKSLFAENSLEEAIATDDIDQVLFYSTATRYYKGYAVFKGREYTLIGMSALFSSINVFKFFLSNHYALPYDIAECAIIGGNEEIISILEAMNIAFDGCFAHAIRNHHNNIAMWLKSNYHTENISLDLAISHCNTLATKYALLTTWDPNYDILDPFYFKAVKISNIMILKMLFSNDVQATDINIKDKEGWSLLSRAAAKNSLDIVTYLIENGSNIEHRDYLKCTPLHRAALRGNTDIIQYLVKKGATIETKNNFSNTPIMSAASFEHCDTIKYLASLGAKKEIKDNKGMTPLNRAAKENSIEVVQTLVSLGANVNTTDTQGKTPLMYAVANKSLELVKYLISKGANAKLKDRSHQMAFNYSNDKDITQFLKKYSH